MRLSLFFLTIIMLVGSAQATVVGETYGDGWRQLCYDDGKCAYSNHHTIQRWDGQYIPIEWLNLNNGNWTYFKSENTTQYLVKRFDDNLTLPKWFGNYTFDLNKISLEFTVTPAQLASRSTLQVIGGQNYWYIVIPDKAAKTRFLWDNKLPIISNETGVILNQSEYDVNGSLFWQNYKYVVVGDEIRLYYNQTARNFGLASSLITFKFDSWIVGTGGNAWSGNSTLINTTLNRDTNNIELRQNVDDDVSYWRFDGSSGITAYDMNLTSNNNGTLVNMSTGLNNGSSGWNSSGKYGNALWFDGVNDYVNMGTMGTFGSSLGSNKSYSMWIKSSNTTSIMAISGVANLGFTTAIILRINANSAEVLSAGNIQLFSRDSSALELQGGVNTNTGITNGNWHHLVVNVQPSNNIISFFVDGAIKTTTYAKQNTPTNFSNFNYGFYIGAWDNRGPAAQCFNGTMDEVRIYNRVLSNDEINLTMNQSKYYSGYVKIWYDAGTGNETYQVSSNGTFQDNSNQSGQYTQNGSSPTGYLSPENQTINYTWATVPSYQNTDWYTWLFGNSTSTPAISSITFWTQAAGAPVETFTQNIYNTGWQTVFINATQNMTQIRSMMNSSNVNWIARWNATSQKFESYKAGWSYRASNNANAGEAVYLKVTNNDTITRSNSTGNYNWTASLNWSLWGLDYNGTRTLSQINASINNLGTCDCDYISYIEPQTMTEYTYTCGLTNNATIEVKQGEGMWVNATTAFDRTRSWS